MEYVDWCRENPIVLTTETKNTSVEGIKYGSEQVEKKPRLVSIGGFLVFIGATRSWWGELDRSQQDFSAVKALIREFCEAYQKEMAATGIFNGNIISRLLGLAEKKVLDHNATSTIVVRSEEEKEKLENIGNLGV